jgi:hypothetical protein
VETIIVIGVCAAMLLGAAAGPLPPARGGPGADGPLWSDNFDSYQLGPIVPQGGWQLWPGADPPPEGYVVNTVASSGAQSLRITNQNAFGTSTDVVQTFALTGGRWRVSGGSYVPSSTAGSGYWIIMNTFPAFDWSVIIRFDATLNTVSDQFAHPALPQTISTTVPLVEDLWVAHETLIDLDARRYTFRYNGQVVVQDGNWGSNPTLQALDCYSDTIPDMFYDDLALESIACYPDCNSVGGLTIADFGCFQTRFVAGDPYADCNGVGGLTIADFGCFQTRFVQGCP